MRRFLDIYLYVINLIEFKRLRLKSYFSIPTKRKKYYVDIIVMKIITMAISILNLRYKLPVFGFYIRCLCNLLLFYVRSCFNSYSAVDHDCCQNWHIGAPLTKLDLERPCVTQAIDASSINSLNFVHYYSFFNYIAFFQITVFSRFCYVLLCNL